MSSQRGNVVALLPAAGYGSRLGGDVPKQNLQLTGGSVLDCTLHHIRSVAMVSEIVLVVSSAELKQRSYPDDVRLTIGGNTRAMSVYNGLKYIHQTLNHDGMVLVHDAARPCVRVADIERLIDDAGKSADGGILAVPMHDTVKRVDKKSRITTTVDRVGLWRAVTPQLFMVGPLLAALQKAAADHIPVTDEASAMEYAGFHPRVVPCAQDNIKITVAEDMALARQILTAQNDL